MVRPVLLAVTAVGGGLRGVRAEETESFRTFYDESLKDLKEAFGPADISKSKRIQELGKHGTREIARKMNIKGYLILQAISGFFWYPFLTPVWSQAWRLTMESLK